MRGRGWTHCSSHWADHTWPRVLSAELYLPSMSCRTGVGHVANILYSAQMSLISSNVIDTVLAMRDIVAENFLKAEHSGVSRKGMMSRRSLRPTSSWCSPERRGSRGCGLRFQHLLTGGRVASGWTVPCHFPAEAQAHLSG